MDLLLPFFTATTTKHVSIQSPSNDISPMSVISGVKSSPRKEKSSLSKKGEKLPRFGVKTEQEPELSTVHKAFCCTPVLENYYALKMWRGGGHQAWGAHCNEIDLASTFRGVRVKGLVWARKTKNFPALASRQNKHQILKSWVPKYQLNCNANSAHLAIFCSKWAGYAVLFCRIPKTAPRILIFSIAMGAHYSIQFPLRPRPPHFLDILIFS